MSFRPIGSAALLYSKYSASRQQALQRLRGAQSVLCRQGRANEALGTTGSRCRRSFASWRATSDEQSPAIAKKEQAGSLQHTRTVCQCMHCMRINARPLYGAQELSCAACWRFGLDRTEQCCGVYLPTFTNRGSASWLSVYTPGRRPGFRSPGFRRRRK